MVAFSLVVVNNLLRLEDNHFQTFVDDRRFSQEKKLVKRAGETVSFSLDRVCVFAPLRQAISAHFIAGML